jgi:hypothetical protein
MIEQTTLATERPGSYHESAATFIPITSTDSPASNMMQENRPNQLYACGSRVSRIMDYDSGNSLLSPEYST